MVGVKSAAFFAAQQPHSKVKTEIVVKYFEAWSKIMASVAGKQPRRIQKIGYLDLFAGPGHFDDGTPSTPLLILEVGASIPEVASRLMAMFNDGHTANAQALASAIGALQCVGQLKHQPVVWSETVGDSTAARFRAVGKKIPLLAFIDPFGYKGLSLDLITAILGDFGGDGIFFFNYNRINMCITHKGVASHVDAIFGKEIAGQLRVQFANDNPSPHAREGIILAALTQALVRYGHPFVLPFTFKNVSARTTHHLVFVSKHPLGHKVMKEIMGRASTFSPQGVPSHAFFPPGATPQFELLDRPLDALRADLLVCYQGRTIATGQLIGEHSVNKRYLPRNYKEALRGLREEGLVTTIPAPTPKTFSDKIVLTFL